jgi:hypothetical protein
VSVALGSRMVHSLPAPGDESGERMSKDDRRRVVIISQSAVELRPAMSPLFEFEEVVAALESAEVVETPYARGQRRFDGSRAVYKAAGTVLSPGLAARLSRPPTITVDGDIDLLLVVVNGLWDLYLLECIPEWRRRSRHVVAYVNETWPAELEGRHRALEPVDGLDLILSGVDSATDELRRLTGRRVAHLAIGVDAERFAPVSQDDPRPVGIINIGRRVPGAHRALLDFAEKRRLFYLYDTFARPIVADHRDHRNFLGRTMQQSVVAVCNYAKFDQPEVIGDQREFGNRFFEASMAGAVIVGAGPNADDVAEHFGWEDAILDAPLEGAGLLDQLHAVFDDEERRRAIHRRNTREALRRHDWAHRWASVLDHLGLPKTEAHEARLAALEERAAALACAGDPTARR